MAKPGSAIRDNKRCRFFKTRKTLFCYEKGVEKVRQGRLRFSTFSLEMSTYALALETDSLLPPRDSILVTVKMKNWPFLEVSS